jgi:hypothetical protein
VTGEVPVPDQQSLDHFFYSFFDPLFFLFQNLNYQFFVSKKELYRFSKISSEIPKVGISGCRKNGLLTERFFDNCYKPRKLSNFFFVFSTFRDYSLLFQVIVAIKKFHNQNILYFLAQLQNFIILFLFPLHTPGAPHHMPLPPDLHRQPL